MHNPLQFDETSLGVTESSLIPPAALHAIYTSDEGIREKVKESLDIHIKKEKIKQNGIDLQSEIKGGAMAGSIVVIVFGLLWVYQNPWTGFIIGFAVGFVVNVCMAFVRRKFIFGWFRIGNKRKR